MALRNLFFNQAAQHCEPIDIILSEFDIFDLMAFSCQFAQSVSAVQTFEADSLACIGVFDRKKISESDSDGEKEEINFVSDKSDDEESLPRFNLGKNVKKNKYDVAK